MKYAIVQSGGKQYKAVEGATIDVDRLPLEEGKKPLAPVLRSTNPINCGFIKTCTFIRVLHFQFLFRIYCFEKSVLNICVL